MNHTIKVIFKDLQKKYPVAVDTVSFVELTLNGLRVVASSVDIMLNAFAASTLHLSLPISTVCKACSVPFIPVEKASFKIAQSSRVQNKMWVKDPVPIP